MTVSDEYVHGYDPRENSRLRDQAATLEELLHHDTCYPAGSRVLEAGCGVEAQTLILARNSPGAIITSIDISEKSIAEAGKRLRAAGYENISFRQADIFNLDFPDNCFDHVFLCFVLEHLADPASALISLKKSLRSGGTITVIEGDHGSAFFHPHDEDATSVIRCLVELQGRAGGNANIGRRLRPLLDQTGFASIKVSPRMVYADQGNPELVAGFTRKTFTAMIEGVRDQALASGMIDADTFDSGIRGLYRTSADDGVFCYTFFKAVAGKP
jgi:ubiquinone/menaquinone biosynthesis C-methylase UbiE